MKRRPGLKHQISTIISPARRDIALRMSQLQLSARAYQRILKLSRAIADLAGSDAIQSAHLAETLL